MDYGQDFASLYNGNLSSSVVYALSCEESECYWEYYTVKTRSMKVCYWDSICGMFLYY